MKTTTKSVNTANGLKTKRVYVKDEDLEKAIVQAANRLAYLRNRKKTGIPGGVTKKDKKEVDADRHYYRYWVKDNDFVGKYVKMREEATSSAKRFVTYHNRLYKVVNKYGTDAEKEALNKIMGANNQEL